MLDKILPFLSDAAPMAIAIVGIIMSYKQPERRNHLLTTIVLIISGVAGTGIVSWARLRAEAAHQRDVDKQTQSIETLKSNLQESEIRRMADTRFLEGKVEVFSQFAPAIVKLAEATELNTRKTYEAKMLSNKDLYDATMDVVKRMRAFGQKRKLESEQQMNARMAAMRNATSEAERSKLWTQENDSLIAAYYRTDAEFRSSILPDAVYVRNELLRRKIPEPPSNPMRPTSMVQMVFAGSLAGPYPEFDAADYLELMAKQLRLK